MARARRPETTLSLDGERTLVITRTFQAPPKAVFECWTKAEWVAQWWAPKTRGSIVSVEADVRAGGRYRYVMRSRRGDEVAFRGVYREVVPSSRLTYTQVFEAMADAGEAVIQVTFEAVGRAETRLVSSERYPSRAIRDVVLSSGMESGMRESLEQLDAVLAKHSPRTVPAYLQALPPGPRRAAKAVRASILRAVPEAEETIKYGMPAFTLGGKAFLHFAVWKAHLGLYPVYPGAPAALERQLARLRAKKDTVQLPLDQPIPEALVERIARYQRPR